ncbi:tail fiber protein [Thalassospira sp.]|uniref:phage tail protein n=1 Tax=Thalassospira sp. TaxID=1912094 RepID=UPI0025E9FC4D|nr:tail fiber protein [Thalassospira sp.]
MGPESYTAIMSCTAANFAPVNTALCQGQILPIANYTSLFSLIGDTFGGDGRTTFGIPDMRGRTAVGAGQGPTLSNVYRGQLRGSESSTVPLPQHTHTGKFASDSQICQVYGTITNFDGKISGNANLNISSTTFAGNASVNGTVPVIGTTPVTLDGYVAVNTTNGNLSAPQMNGSLAKATAGGSPVNMFDTGPTPDDVKGAAVKVSGDVPATGKTVDGSGFSIDTSNLSVSVNGYAETNLLDVMVPDPAFDLWTKVPETSGSIFVDQTGQPDAEIGTIPPQLGVNWLIMTDGIYPPRP